MGVTRAFAALLGCLLGPLAALATAPELSELPALTPFGVSQAFAVSRDDRVVAGQANGVAVQWIDGAVTTLAVPGMVGGVVLDASGDGSVLVGESPLSVDSGEGVLWRDGEAIRLGRTPGSSS